MLNGKIENKRIVAIDLLRALAVILMVEGHAVHVFLNTQATESGSAFYSLWVWLRGFTAPLFMFISGLIFTYLLIDNKFNIKGGRLKKGLRRGGFLIALGYLLRFPTLNPFRVSNISGEQIRTFFAVDALHIIGFGLIAISIVSIFLNKILRTENPGIYFVLIGLTVFALGNFIGESETLKNLPRFIRAYFDYSEGSIFILFPWLGYMFLGASLAILIKKFRTNENVLRISAYVSFLIFFGALIYRSFYGENYWSILIERSSFVVSLYFLTGRITKNLRRVPKPLLILGKNTLLIYIVHLVILYGSPLSLGFYQIVPQSLTTLQTAFAVLLMETIMFYIAMLKEKNTLNSLLKFKKAYAEIE